MPEGILKAGGATFMISTRTPGCVRISAGISTGSDPPLADTSLTEDIFLGQRTIQRHLRRLGAFGASVVITTVVGVLAIPVVIANTGSQIWGVIALGQATALLFGVLVSFGWGTTGPALVAGMPAEGRPQMYLDSLVSRLYLFCLAAPLAVLTVWLIANDFQSVAVLACLAYLLPFLGASWFFVGDGRPGRLLLFDTVPVTLGTVLGLIGLTLTTNVYVYLTIQLAMNLVAVVDRKSVV